jgi:hypothetical protein
VELGTATGSDNHEERETPMRKIILAATGAVVAVAGIVGLAGPAAAETGTTATITMHTTGYQWPTKQSPAAITGLTPGQQVTALCFTDDGEPVNGNPYWFRISKTATPDGNTAFVPREAISVSNNVPNCWPNGN